MILSRGGIHGKTVGSNPAFEERTGQSATRSPTLHCSTHGFGKLELKRAEHSIGCCSEEDQPGAESTVGQDERSSAEAQEHDFNRRQEKNRGGTAGKVGKGTGGAEEGGVAEKEDIAKYTNPHHLADKGHELHPR